MKILFAVAAMCSVVLFLAASTSGNSSDPCRQVQPNADEGKCYAREQTRINVQLDVLVSRYVSDLQHGAAIKAKDEVVADLLRKSATALASSQASWKVYREQYCKAVEYSYTTGSGAGIAYESCMYELGQKRARELWVNFAEMDFRPH